MDLLRHPVQHWKALAVFTVIVVLYFYGTFDRILVNIGLQSHECVRNAIGTIFCGKEATEYREHVQTVKESLERIKP